MTEERDFSKELGALCRRPFDALGCLDKKLLSAPFLPPGIEFIRVNAFPEQESPSETLPRMKDILAGMHGAAQQAALFFESSRGGLAVHYGQSNEGGLDDAGFLPSALRGSFPGIDLGTEAPGHPVQAKVAALAVHSAVMTGLPGGVETTLAEKWEPGFNSVIRALRGRNFGILVTARPVAAAMIEQGIDIISKRIDECFPLVKVSVHTQARYSDQEAREVINTRAERYCQALRDVLERLRRGRLWGTWAVRILLLADKVHMLEHLGGLVKSAFAGAPPAFEPLRILPLRSGGAQASSAPEYPLSRLLPAFYETLQDSLDLAQFFVPPTLESPGYDLVRRPAFGLHQAEHTAHSDLLEIGAVIDRNAPLGVTATIPLAHLSRHALIAGVTGSGKTNTCFHILTQLWERVQPVPFLVIEPAKSEYRRLLSRPLFQNGLLYTLGDETGSPFRLNPFDFPRGFAVLAHADHLRAVFNASFAMYPPMPHVLEKCVLRVYEAKGWDLLTGTNRDWPDPHHPDSWAFPTLSDLYEAIDPVVEELGYDDRISRDVKAALKVRIGSLRVGGKGAMLDTPRSICFETLLSQPSVLELEMVAQDEEKAFIIALLVNRLFEYRRSLPIASKGTLVHVTLIEEAHRLISKARAGGGNPEVADPKAKAVEALSQMLSEIRSYGEGILIAEQIPVKLAEDALKNTSLKIVHRLVAADDRAAMAGCMAMNASQEAHLSVLESGQAAVFFEGLDEPMAVKIPLSGIDAAGIEPSDYMKDKRAETTIRSRRLPGCGTCLVPCPIDSMRTGRSSGSDEPGPYFRFLHSLLFRTGQWRKALEESRRAVRLLTGGDERCYFVQAGWKHLTSKARFAGIDPTRIVGLQERICALIESETSEPSFGTNSKAEAISQELKALFERASGPFAGCSQFCGRKCYFGYEASLLLHRPEVRRRLRRAVIPRTVSGLAALRSINVRYCRALGRRIVGRLSGEEDSLGLCLFISYLNRLKSPYPLSDIRDLYVER